LEKPVLLTPGATSWKTAAAPRASLLIDMEAYFDAAMDAMRHAKHCVHLLNWAFEANTLSIRPQLRRAAKPTRSATS
jgi:hypothetical protein